MKYCKKCDSKKDFCDFFKDKTTKDGFRFYCKLCVNEQKKHFKEKNPEKIKEYQRKHREINKEKIKEDSRKRRQENPGKYLEKGRISYHKHKEEIAKRRKSKRDSSEAREKANSRIALWRRNNKEKFRKSVRKWQISNRIKTNAHAKVHTAVANGTLIRNSSCQECDKVCKTEGHHEDYSKPLDVVWLCRRCHASKIETVEVYHKPSL